MQLDPQRLIDESISQLTQLSTLFTNEIRGESVLETLEQRACEEAIERIGNLIPTLRVARNARIAPLDVGLCLNCDE